MEADEAVEWRDSCECDLTGATHTHLLPIRGSRECITAAQEWRSPAHGRMYSCARMASACSSSVPSAGTMLHAAAMASDKFSATSRPSTGAIRWTLPRNSSRCRATLSDPDDKSKVARDPGTWRFKLATRSPRWHGRLADRCGTAPLTSGKLVTTRYLSC